jgi:DNA-binding FadR family transcriptional regulator
MSRLNGNATFQIESRSVTNAIIDQVLKNINAGTWKNGERLPPQRQLADDFNISMTSLREALHTLQGMGIIKIVHGEGTYVTDDVFEAIQRCFNVSRVFDRSTLEDFITVRHFIEGDLAYLAAKCATNLEIDELNQITENMRIATLARDTREITNFDEAFHSKIAQMSRSSLLQKLLETLFEFTNGYFHTMPHSLAGWENHFLVCEAITNHDPELSRKRIQNLVDEVGVYSQFIEKNEK